MPNADGQRIQEMHPENLKQRKAVKRRSANHLNLSQNEAGEVQEHTFPGLPGISNQRRSSLYEFSCHHIEDQ